MNIKRLCLIAALLGLPVAYANAGLITISVPVDITNLPAANRTMKVNCGVRAAETPQTFGSGSVSFIVNKNFNGTKQVPIVPIFGYNLDDATSYDCSLTGVAGEPTVSVPAVRGLIPR